MERKRKEEHWTLYWQAYVPKLAYSQVRGKQFAEASISWGFSHLIHNFKKQQQKKCTVIKIIFIGRRELYFRSNTLSIRSSRMVWLGLDTQVISILLMAKKLWSSYLKILLLKIAFSPHEASFKAKVCYLKPFILKSTEA